MEDTDDTDVKERPDDFPEGVPAKATITIKEINDNRYSCWQWRERRCVRPRIGSPPRPFEL